MRHLPRTATLATFALVLAVPLAACGDDDVDLEAEGSADAGSSGSTSSGSSSGRADAGASSSSSSSGSSGAPDGGDAGDAAARPSIESFAAAKSILTVGDATTLIASFAGGTGNIEGLGPVESGVPIATGALAADTTFTLTVSGAGGDVTATANVQVVAAPTIATFAADKARVPSGSTVTLTATFAGGTGAVDQQVGAVTSAAPIVTPPLAAATTYTLTVTNAAGASVTATTAVELGGEFFVSDFGRGEVHAFALDAANDAAPLRTLAGEATGLSAPRGLAVVGDELFVADQGANAILVFDAAATGDVAPKRAIRGDATTLQSTSGILIANGRIYIGDQSATVKAFPFDGNGNIAPIVLQGALTGLADTHYFALDGGELYTANWSHPTVSVFAADATGNTAPLRTLAVPQPLGLVLRGNELIVSTGGAAIITIDKNTGAEVRRITGDQTGIGFTDQCAVLDAELYCSDFGAGVVVFPVAATGNVAPTRTLKGSLQGALGFAFR